MNICVENTISEIEIPSNKHSPLFSSLSPFLSPSLSLLCCHCSCLDCQQNCVTSTYRAGEERGLCGGNVEHQVELPVVIVELTVALSVALRCRLLTLHCTPFPRTLSPTPLLAIYSIRTSTSSRHLFLARGCLALTKVFCASSFAFYLLHTLRL